MLAFTRINYPMTRVKSPGSDQVLKLNVHLYWRNPAEVNRTDIDGALRGFGYKIKGAAKADDQRVVKATREWPLEAAANPYDSNIAFYRHVSSADELDQTAETLVEHFSEFGSDYGIVPDE